MTDKKLSRSMEILEVVIQMITFYSAFMAVYFGALQKPVSQLWESLIIFVFVAAAYYSRRKIKLFKPFIVLHIAIIAAAFFMGTTDAERFSYFLIAALIAGYSIRLKTITLQKNDLSNTPLSDDADGLDLAEQLEIKKNLVASEQIPLPFCAFMILGYMIGHLVESNLVMNSEVVLFVLFVLLEVVYRDLKKLNTVFLTNKDKTHFPVQQLKQVNTRIILTTVFLMLIAMLLFYNGEYGNIFQVIGAGGMAALKGLLKVILAIWGSGGGDSTVAEEQTTQAETDADLSDVEEIYEPSAAASAVLEALAVILIIAAAAGICYLIYRYVKNFNKKRKPQGYIEEITTLEKETVRVRKQKTETDTIKTAPETESLRKAYKRQVLKKAKEHRPDGTQTPQELTTEYITKDDGYGAQITQLYEKARYAKEPVSKEETKHFKEMLKQDLTS